MRMKRVGVIAAALAAAGGVAYLATLGCCQILAGWRRPASLADRLSLTPGQREAVGRLEKDFLARKGRTCQTLCAKRAQLIELLRQPDPDRAMLARLAGEIGEEQTALERATLDHILAVGRHLEPSQRERLIASVREGLQAACRATGCGRTEGCSVVEGNAK